MFVDNESWDVEEICYDHTHIQDVVNEIKKNFDRGRKWNITGRL